MILVKLGGSVITDKSCYRRYRSGTVKRLCREIAASGKDVVLVHGAGSFGHVIAKEFRLNEGNLGEWQIPGLVRCLGDVRDLDRRVCGDMEAKGLRPFPVPPSSCVTMRNGHLDMLDLGIFRRALDQGMTPVTYGDMALDSEMGFSVCSGDELMLRLAQNFKFERAIFCADVDGVCTADPTLDPKAELIPEIDDSTLASLPRTERTADVTGSIYGKIEFMLRMSSLTEECVVVNGKKPGRLLKAMRGEEVISSRVRREGR
jgi:isopentenyl phosphate kinase